MIVTILGINAIGDVVKIFELPIIKLFAVVAILDPLAVTTGVVDATIYGVPLFVLKIINIYLFAFWLIIHNLDIKDEKLPYTKAKFGFFILVFLLFLSELVIEFLMFDAIDIDKMVSCCGTIYSNSSTSLISNIFVIDISILLSLFYGLFLFLVVSYRLKLSYLFSITNVSFLIISIVSLISFFGTYIYELPTHHCPFCFLQKEYYYVGYFIYSFLFIGTFFGFVASIIKQSQTYYQISLWFSFLYLVLVSAYPIVFYIKNGVWL